VSSEEGAGAFSPRRAVAVFVTLAGVAAAMTLLFLSMRAVMRIGGSCASGGPYVPRQACPHGVPLALIGGIWGGLVFAGLYWWQSASAHAPSFVFLLWPALFLSLGWNFLQFGLHPPEGQGVVAGWLVCAVLFILMGGVPLVAVLLAKAYSPARTSSDPFGLQRPSRQLFLRAAMAGMGAVGPPSGSAGSAADPGVDPSASPDATLVSELERLAKLHMSGSLTDDEYQAAKRNVLEAGA
jgi:hypothetical protein